MTVGIDTLRRGGDHVAAWLSRYVPHYTFAFLLFALGTQLSIDDRIHVAGVALNLVAAILVVCAPMMVLFGIWHLLRRSHVWIKRVYHLAVIATLLSFALLMILPAVNANLELERAMRVSFGEHYVRIGGAMSHELPHVLERGLGDDFHPSRVFFANQGGDVAGGMAAVDLLRRRGVDTAVVDGPCDSACAYSALLFPVRLLGVEGSLGFHDLQSFNAVDRRSQAELKERLIERLRSQGYAEPVIAGMFATREIHRPARATLIADGLVTGCWEPSAQQAVPCTP